MGDSAVSSTAELNVNDGGDVKTWQNENIGKGRPASQRYVWGKRPGREVENVPDKWSWMFDVGPLQLNVEEKYR